MALRDDSVRLDDPRLAAERKLAVVMGTEGDGLADATIAACDYTVRIPMHHGRRLAERRRSQCRGFLSVGKTRGITPLTNINAMVSRLQTEPKEAVRMEKKLDLEDTVRAVTEQPWARIRAFMKPVIPALAAVLIAAACGGCTMMDSVPQETPASEVEPPEALIKARVEDAEPADEQLNVLLEKAGASVLTDSEQAAFCAYLLDNFDELEGRGVLDAESRWTASG